MLSSKQHQLRSKGVACASSSSNTPSHFCIALKNDDSRGSTVMSTPSSCWLSAHTNTQRTAQTLHAAYPLTRVCADPHCTRVKLTSLSMCFHCLDEAKHRLSPPVAAEPLGLLLTQLSITHQLHKAALVWLCAWCDDPAVHLIQVDAVHVQPLTRGTAVLRRCQVGPAIQPSARICMALQELTQPSELLSSHTSVLCSIDASAVSPQPAEIKLCWLHRSD